MASSSRLCVRGLPKHVGEKDLRNHFSGKWTLTDVKVARTRDGNSRQFGFVGFETVEDAESAKKYFNKSYMGVTKLVIEFARQMNSGSDVRPWSKYSKGSSAHDKLKQSAEKSTPENPKATKVDQLTKERQKMEEGAEEDPKLKEFLELMQPRSKMQSWGNADSALTAFNKGAGEEDGEVPEEGGSTESSDAEEETEDKRGEVAVSDMDYLRSKMRQDFDVESEGGSSEDLEEILSEASSSELEEIFSDGDGEATEHRNPRASMAEQENGDLEELEENFESTSGRRNEEESAEEVVSKTKRLFVRNLSYKATEADLISLFEEFGDIVEVNLAVDKRTGRSKGFALIHFSEAEAAINGLKQMDGQIFQGRLLHILPGKAPPEPITDDPNEEGQSQQGGFKSEKAAKEKANLGNRSAWNTLFMRADTVTEAIAAHYGVSKSELMDRDASDLGVRMALGETQIIAKTKEALGEAGVSVEKMEEAAAAAGKASSSVSVSRSSTTLLVKNLPYMSEREELQGMFGDIGPLLRVVLPPTKVLAIVEFQDSSDAQRAFRCLAYRKYHGVPIYLEWAPLGVFMVHADRVLEPLQAQKKQPEQPKDDVIAEEEAAKEPVAIERASIEEILDSGDETTVASATVYVKNLSFTTTEAGLRSHFDNVVSEIGGRLNSTVLATRLRNDGRRVSAGYGFVEVDSERVVKHVIKTLQGSLLDGHKLELQRSLRKSSKSQLAAATSTRKRKAQPDVKSTKLIVRNLAFEATKQDIMGLFGPFGHIKTCRLPKKFDGTHRGFAFVDFVTKQEAESAKDGVTGAHLYGRRLVIEYAKDDDGSVDALRAKTAKKFNAGEGLKA